MVYFSDYIAASYGWPFYIHRTKLAFFKLIPSCFSVILNRLRAFYSKNISNTTANEENLAETNKLYESVEIENDNCCLFYINAVIKQLPKSSEKTVWTKSLFSFYKQSPENKHIKIIYANFFSDVWYLIVKTLISLN